MTPKKGECWWAVIGYGKKQKQQAIEFCKARGWTSANWKIVREQGLTQVVKK